MNISFRLPIVLLSLLALPALASDAEPSKPEAVHIDIEAMEWTPATATADFPAGRLRKALHRNPLNGAAAAVLRHPKGYLEPRHYHSTANHGVYILKGKVRVGNIEAGPGHFFYAPAGHAHGPIETLEDVEFILWTDGPLDVHMGDPEPTDDERP